MFGYTFLNRGGTTYSFRVSGRGNGVLYSTSYGSTTSTSGSTYSCPRPTPTPVPPPPTPVLEVSATSQTSITLRWDARAGVSYTLQHSSDGGSTWHSSGDPIAGRNGEVSKEVTLACGTAYSFRARGRGTGSPFSTAYSAWSSSESGRTTGCDPPQPIMNAIGATTQTSVTVSWKLPPGSGAVASYKLERSADNDNTTWPQPNDDNFPNYAGHVIEGITETMQEVTGLTCGVTYYFRVSARGGGTTYADTHGPTSDPPAAGSTLPCLTPPPAPSNITAVRNDNGIAVSWDTETGVASYKLEGSNDNGSTWTFYTKDNITPVSPRTLHQVTGLTCGPTYVFRVSALGDGTKYKAVYGATELAGFTEPGVAGQSTSSAATARSTSGAFCLAPLPTPEVDVIPLPRRIAQIPRRIRLRWDEIAGASSFNVHIAKSTVDFDTHAQEFCASPQLKHKCDIRVDNVVGGEGLADVGAGEGFRIRVTVNFTDTSLDSQYSDVIIVDSPIRSVNGDADDTLFYNGRFKVKWNKAGTASDNVQYTLRWRVLRPYETVSRALLRHDNPDWHPTEWKSKDRGTPYDWASKKTSALEYTIDHALPERFMLITEEIYAFQLNYTINGTKYFSAHEAYGWTSNRAADEEELIATFPTILRHRNKTYAYNICESTFSSDDIRQADWRKMIVHALGQWETVTDGLVTMRLNATSDGMSEPCTNYDPLIRIIEDAIEAEVQTGLPIDTSQIREYVKGLSQYTNLARMDREMNEIKMVHVDESEDTYATSFNELADLVGFADCIVVHGAAACTSYSKSYPHLADIQIHGRYADIPPFLPPIVDDECISGSDEQKRLYERIVHEGGHALGIFREGGESFTEQRDVHPQVVSSVMSYARIRGEYCSPRPLDIMAIYAIYQTLP